MDTFSRSVRRTIVLASQSLAWFSSHLLKLGFTIELHHPPGFLTRGPERCLILACSHKSVLDPWLIISALRYRQWRMLMPVRTLATQTFRGALKWLKPIIRLLYRLEGAIELPPKQEGGTLPEKVQGLLDALRQGDVVAIFPEGGVWKNAPRQSANLPRASSICSVNLGPASYRSPYVRAIDTRSQARLPRLGPAGGGGGA